MPASTDKSNVMHEPAAPRPLITVGQALWWVTSANSRDEGQVTVLKIDGNLAQLCNGATLNLDSMNAIPDPVPLGRCYLSREEHQASLRLLDEWADFCRDINGISMPKDISTDDIRAYRMRFGMGKNNRRTN